MADKNGGTRNDRTSFQESEEEASEEIRKYRQILLKEPSSMVFAALAEAYRKRRLLDKAIEVCRTGLRFHPDFPSGRVALARAYYDAGEMDKARQELERVASSVPDNLVAQRLLADIYREKGDVDNLEKTLHRILSFDPHESVSKEMLRRVEADKDLPGDARPGQSPPKEIITKTLAEIYAAQGYYEKALYVYQQLCRQDPDNPLYHGRLADLKEKVSVRLLRSKEKRHPEQQLPEGEDTDPED